MAINLLCLQKVPCEFQKENFLVPGFTRPQFPARACLAITINKARGQSFGGKRGIELRDECFFHGKLYGALFNTTHPSNVTIQSRPRRIAKNVVYRDVLTLN